MRKNKIIILIFTLLVLTGLSYGKQGDESFKDIFDKARLDFLDEKWDQALKGFDRVTQMSPNSSYYAQALFYKGKCFKKKDMPKRALENYIALLKVTQDNFLKEQANISVIDMSYAIYEKFGNRRFLKDIVSYLDNNNDALRWYAALILSKSSEKSIAAKAVPVLKKIVDQESDQELVDRAKIALMRIAPEQLKKISAPKNLSSRLLVIKVTDKKTKKESFSFSISFALAQLALESLPDKEKKLLEEKGYRLEQILETIVKTGDILKIESEDGIFKIWIE